MEEEVHYLLIDKRKRNNDITEKRLATVITGKTHHVH